MTALSQTPCMDGMLSQSPLRGQQFWVRLNGWWQHWVRLHDVDESAESDFDLLRPTPCCWRQHWVRLHDVDDSTESDFMMLTTALSQTPHDVGNNAKPDSVILMTSWDRLRGRDDSAESAFTMCQTRGCGQRHRVSDSLISKASSNIMTSAMPVNAMSLKVWIHDVLGVYDVGNVCDVRDYSDVCYVTDDCKVRDVRVMSGMWLWYPLD